MPGFLARPVRPPGRLSAFAPFFLLHCPPVSLFGPDTSPNTPRQRSKDITLLCLFLPPNHPWHHEVSSSVLQRSRVTEVEPRTVGRWVRQGPSPHNVTDSNDLIRRLVKRVAVTEKVRSVLEWIFPRVLSSEKYEHLGGACPGGDTSLGRERRRDDAPS